MLGWVSRSSLKGQLVIRFSALLGALMLIMMVGILAVIALILPPISDADQTLRPIIAKALRSNMGHIAIGNDQELRKIQEKSPNFWFVASLHGERVTYGAVPNMYQSVLEKLEDFVFFDARERDGSALTASIAELDSPAGTVKVMYGGSPEIGPFLYNVILGLSVFYVPLIIIPVSVVFLALPSMVGRSLSGLQRTISEAASIDAKSLGIRLPKQALFGSFTLWSRPSIWHSAGSITTLLSGNDFLPTLHTS